MPEKSISDLERKMLECDKHCANHEDTVKSVDKLEKCMVHNKHKVDKLCSKFSWLIGLLFFAGIALGYCAKNITMLQNDAKAQYAKNQLISDHSIQIQKLTSSSGDKDITLAQIKYDIKYIKRDLIEIKKLLKRDNS